MRIRKLFYRVLMVVILCAILLPWSGGSLSRAARAACPVTAENWHEVGTDSACAGGISDNNGYSGYPSVAIAPDGRPYVSWHDHSSGGNPEIYVRRWNGSSWEEVGAGSASGGGISDNSGWSERPSVAVAPDGTPYLAWCDYSSGDAEIYVRRWNGSSWEEVGAGSATGGGISDNSSDSYSPSVAIALDGTPYVAWYDGSSGDAEIYVRRWNGSSWEEVGAGSATGGGISDNGSDSYSPSVAIALNGTPYLAWNDNSGGGNPEIYVRRWNGSSWEEVGAGSASGGGISDNSDWSEFPSVAVAPDGIPYVAWNDWSVGNPEIYVRHWNGSSWEEVGAGSASGGGISDNSGLSRLPSMAVAPDGTPYIAWYDGSSGDAEIYVRRWNGSSWEEVGAGSASGGGISDNSSDSYSPSVAIAPGGTPYVAWYDDSSGDSEIYVRRKGAEEDTDGDGLLDAWEIYGYDGDGDGTPDINLPAMGANPLKKDIFVEVDYMVDHGLCLLGHCVFGHSHEPKVEAINTVVQAFANAGIHLHVDYGSDAPLTWGSAATWGELSHSEAIPHQDTLQPSNETWDWSGFDRIKNDQGHFDPRRTRIFHYVIFAHYLGGRDENGHQIPLGTSGISRNDASSDAAFRRGASDFIVSLGQWTDNVGTAMEQAGTFMHELGHNLGLRHGGDDHQNFEPNYLSVMNYSFQTNGLIISSSDGYLDYSRFGNIPPLDEAHLNETVGLNGGSAISNYGTRYYCRPSGNWQDVRVTNANGPINWDCLGEADDTDVQANINDGDPNQSDPTISTLTGFSDWSALVFDGGPIGPDTGLAASALLPTQSTPTGELTFEVDSQFYRPYKIALTGGGYTVASLGVTTTTSITLTNLGALTATASLDYLPGNGWFDMSAMSVSVTLLPSATLSIPITLTVPDSRSGDISDSVTISATVQEAPLIGDSATLNARIGPLAQYIAEPVSGNAPLVVTFTDASVGEITTWLWDFGDCVISTLPSPTHIYIETGVYTVTLTVSGPDGSNVLMRPNLIRVSQGLYLPIILKSY